MNKYLDIEESSLKIFDDLMSQVIDAIDNDEFDPIIWVEKDTVMKCGYNDELDFLSEYVLSILENVSTKKRMDLEKVRKRMNGKIRIMGGLSYGE